MLPTPYLRVRAFVQTDGRLHLLLPKEATDRVQEHFKFPSYLYLCVALPGVIAIVPRDDQPILNLLQCELESAEITLSGTGEGASAVPAPSPVYSEKSAADAKMQQV